MIIKRFLKLSDLFEVRCKKCNSTKVSLSAQDCHECGDYVTGECDSCDSRYDYHDFKEIEVKYDNKGNEIENSALIN